MEIEGVVRDGLVVPENGTVLPEGTKVRIVVDSSTAGKSFGQRYGRFRGKAHGLPADLAEQHEHYRLGTPKR